MLIVWADARSATVFARGPLALVLADACTVAQFATAPLALVLAKRRSSTRLAVTPPAPVLAQTRFDTGAVFAAGPRTAVGTEVWRPPRRGLREVHLPHRSIIHASRVCGRHSCLISARL